MSERDAVDATPEPRTRAGLAADLRSLGLPKGSVVLVHASLRTLGWVAGGAQATVLALWDVLGPSGTLVVPTHSAQLTEPATWRAPPVPAAWHAAIREALPAFDARTTPTRGMGAVAELVRTAPGARRSPHPYASFAALGPLACRITRTQPLEDPYGEESPLACLHQLGAWVLLLGVGFGRCTALHLAERRAWPDRPPDEEGAPLLVAGERRWVRHRVPPRDTEPFPAVGRHLTDLGLVRRGAVGSSTALLLSLAPAVDAAVALWRASGKAGRS